MLFLSVLALAVAAPAAADPDRVVLIDIEGAIGTGTADYVSSALKQGAERNADVIVIRMDTPGGLATAMRDIIKDILGSPVPVVSWVAPGGARADSAGTYILMASHVAVMADTTHLGAATPVNMIGGSGDDAPPLPGGVPTPGESTPQDAAPADEPSGNEAGEEPEAGDDAPTASQPGTAMERKVMNDAIAYIRALAESRGRNAEWAEAAVRDAATLTSREALEQNVIDLMADDLPELLAALDGREIDMGGETVTLATANAAVETIEPTWRQKLLSAIASPEIAILLMFAGIYGLVFEGWNPGAIVPGVVGAICLLLAAYALNVMPVNYVGLGLILLGVLLITAEMFVPSFGALGIGGIAAFIFGAIMMFDTGIPGYEISLWFVVGVAALSGLAIMSIGYFAARLFHRGAVTGEEQLLKSVAVATESFETEGQVLIEGEMWHARSRSPVRAGDRLHVVRIDGLVLEVEPAPLAAEPAAV